MNQDLPAVPRSLSESLKNNRLVLFIGSGLSRSARAPSWAALVQGIAQRFDDECVQIPDREKDGLAKLVKGSADDLIWAVEYLKSIRPVLVGEHIREACKNLNPHTVHELITEIPCAGIITTNFDNLIERAFKGRINVILPENISALAQMEDQSPWLLKLHGSYENPETTTLALTDYERGAGKGLAATLSRILQQYTVLFLGFGLRDPDTLQQLRHLQTLFRGFQKTHYALIEQDEVDAVRASVLNQVYNVQVLNYRKTADNHPEVSAFLKRLLTSRGLASERKVRKLLFVVQKTASDAEDSPLLLVQSPDSPGSPQNQVYWLPSLTDERNFTNERLMEEAMEFGRRHWAMFDKSFFTLELDENVFPTKKYSPSFGAEIDHEIRFVRIRPNPVLWPHLQDGVTLSGHRFEWRAFSFLQNHEATKKNNGDVLKEIIARYSSRS